jgi:hypothetical protein
VIPRLHSEILTHYRVLQLKDSGVWPGSWGKGRLDESTQGRLGLGLCLGSPLEIEEVW